MDYLSRRKFLSGTLMAGVSLPAASWLERAQIGARGQAGQPRVAIDPERSLPPLDRNLFGSFIEHIGRAVYEGIYDPASPHADANGFRTDVLEVIRGAGVPVVRYPGGNFVSGYHWLDGVGPKKDRPRVLDKAWNSIDTNQFGTDEFITWCRAAGCEPLFGTNLGTGTPEMSAALLEYCNIDGGTKWSDLRRKNGYEKPHNVKYWCLGNEMDGPWQIGHMPATEYGIKARDTANQMRMVDRNVTLFACGSSTPGLPTYLEWDRQTLEQCYDLVDGLSLHRYFGNDEETGGNSAKYLAMNLSMDLQIEEMIAVCDMVRGRMRSRKTLALSFDEWNVWYRARGPKYDNGHRQEAPHLIEEVYNLEDALLVGGLINTLIRRSDRVRVACLAQLVNVIAPIMTNENGLYLQTIWYPYSWALKYARGRALDLLPESPTYPVAGMGDVPVLDVAGTIDDASHNAVIFVLNRDLEKPHDLRLEWRGVTPTRVIASHVITGNDLKATNDFDAPKRVVPTGLEAPRPADRMTLHLPPRSYSVIQLSVA